MFERLRVRREHLGFELCGAVRLGVRESCEAQAWGQGELLRGLGAWGPRLGVRGSCLGGSGLGVNLSMKLDVPGLGWYNLEILDTVAGSM